MQGRADIFSEMFDVAICSSTFGGFSRDVQDISAIVNDLEFRVE